MKLTRILTGVLVLVMCCATAPQFSVVEPLTATASCGVVTGSCGDNATYTFDENEGADYMVIQGVGEIQYTDEWDSCKIGMETIIIEDGITSIGCGAFQEFINLTSIKLPDTVTDIVSDAFLNCSELNSITVPKSVASIGEHALGYTIDDSVYRKVDGFTIYGYKNSVAEDYANSNGFTFVPIDEMLGKLGVVMLKKQILGVTDYRNTYINLDYNNDDIINILDLVQLKKQLFS